MQNPNLEQEVITLSKAKWDWMAQCKIDSLEALFHEKSVFVHMGGAWGRHKKWTSFEKAESITRKRTSMKCL